MQIGFLVGALSGLVVVTLISLLLNKLQSLPADLLSSGLSAIVLFLSKIAEEDGRSINPQTFHPVDITILVILASLIFSFVSISVMFVVGKKRVEHNLKDCDLGGLLMEFGYCFSLLLSVVFLMSGFVLNLGFNRIIVENYTDAGQLQEIALLINKYYNISLLFELTIVLYVIFLAIRYGYLCIQPKLTKSVSIPQGTAL